MITKNDKNTLLSKNTIPNIPSEIKKNKRYTGVIEKTIFGGKGLLHLFGFAIILKNGIEGQKVEYQITKLKKNYAEGIIEHIITPSPLEKPLENQKNHLPGCAYQHLEYHHQLEIKHRQLQEIFRSFSLPSSSLPPFLPSPKEYEYRNKMEFSIGYERMTSTRNEEGKKIWTDEGVCVGFHPPKNWAQVISVEDVFIAPKSFGVLRKVFEDSLKTENGWGKSPWNPLNKKGFWREFILRKSEYTQEILVNIVVSKSMDSSFWEPIIALLQSVVLPEGERISGIVETVNTEQNSGLENASWSLLWGKDSLIEQLGNFTYSLSPFSFFQTNTQGAQVLYNTLLESLGSGKVLLDLFCGTGSIGIFCSQKAEKIIGIELIPEAVEMAKENIRRNNITQAEFFAGKAENLLPSVLEQHPVDTVVIDPPRSGMHPKALLCLAELPVQKMVYVSCNPTTLARDAEKLAEYGWSIVRVQGVDMFPHTPHMEVVSVFERQE